MTTKDDSDTTDRASETKEMTIRRVIAASPERVYQAFVNPDELAEWIHPPGFNAEVHHLEPEEGGTYRITMSGVTAETRELEVSYTGTFEEMVPGERIVQTEVFDAEAVGMTGEMQVTITFEEVPDGTEVTVRPVVPSTWPDDAMESWKGALENLAGHVVGENSRPGAGVRVDHFEIPAADPESVVTFYEDTFGWTAEKWDGPVDYWLLWTDDGIDGAVMRRDGPDPTDDDPVAGYLCTLAVDDIEAALETVEANDGTALGEPEEIPDVGRHAYAVDPAGNQFGLIEPVA